jgi:predicted nucleotidyltransferase
MDTAHYRTEYLPDIARTYGLRLVLLFGSRVSGKTHAESDYDIGYVSREPLTLAQQGTLISDLMRVVQVHDERSIDLVNLRTAPPLLLHIATSEGVPLYEEEPTSLATLQAYAFARYMETLPLRKANYEQLKERYLAPV